MSNYKLTPEIKLFIINQKKANPGLSCRNFVPLIEDNFKVKLSKSLINRVIKEVNLSSLPGRRKVEQKNEESICLICIDNGGYIFLKVADIKLSLTSNLTNSLSVHFPHIPRENLQKMNEILVYKESFKAIPSNEVLDYKKAGLWWLMDGENPLNQISLSELGQALIKLNIIHNINEIKELYKQYLLRLNSYIQENFFPLEYRFLDFFSMRERFYGLPANIERKPGLSKIRLFYPQGFFWTKDPIWQEGFSYAANKINEAGIFFKEGEQIWLSPYIEI